MIALRAICVLMLGIAAAVQLNSTKAQMAFTGPAHVIDGDTIEVQGQRIRLYGMDAPEREQFCRDGRGANYACGFAAMVQMMELTQMRQVECLAQSTDRYGRVVATCTVDGRDLGDDMVRLGLALDYPRYSHGAYAQAEKSAREAKLGMWQGEFQRPDQWRHRGR